MQHVKWAKIQNDEIFCGTQVLETAETPSDHYRLARFPYSEVGRFTGPWNRTFVLEFPEYPASFR